MESIGLFEAKTHLSRLVDLAAGGEPSVIAKAGKPMVQVSAIPSTPAAPPRRLGFMAGLVQVPADFDRLGEDEVVALFGGGGL